MKRSFPVILIIILIALLTGCLPGAATVDPGPIYTEVALTRVVQYTMVALQATLLAPTATKAPITDTPTATETPAPSETPAPVINTPAQSTPLPQISFTPEPPTATPTPAGPMITAISDTNCRRGPGGGYSLQNGGLHPGDRVPVKGRISTSTWWLIQDPDDASKTCWVWSQTTSVEGDVNSIPVIALPPTPKPTAEPTFTVDASIYPSYYSGKCPAKITLNATFYSDKALDVQYKWSDDFGFFVDDDVAHIKDAGTYTFTGTVLINKNVNGSFRIKVNSPYSMKSDKVSLQVHCKNK